MPSESDLTQRIARELSVLRGYLLYVESSALPNRDVRNYVDRMETGYKRRGAVVRMGFPTQNLDINLDLVYLRTTEAEIPAPFLANLPPNCTLYTMEDFTQRVNEIEFQSLTFRAMNWPVPHQRTLPHTPPRMAIFILMYEEDFAAALFEVRYLSRVAGTAHLRDWLHSPELVRIRRSASVTTPSTAVSEPPRRSRTQSLGAQPNGSYHLTSSLRSSLRALHPHNPQADMHDQALDVQPKEEPKEEK